MSEDIGEATADLLKEMVEEIRTLRQRIDHLESNNNALVKAVDDPETMMKKAGWLRAVTPMAEEVFDPLQREQTDTFTSAFNSESIVKSQSDELREWEQMESDMPTPSSPSSIKYR
tara:strand:+ start:8864 stop:9211 length:348 start_codon:yes stop_codon:yes gene_type:complete